MATAFGHRYLPSIHLPTLSNGVHFADLCVVRNTLSTWRHRLDSFGSFLLVSWRDLRYCVVHNTAFLSRSATVIKVHAFILTTKLDQSRGRFLSRNANHSRVSLWTVHFAEFLATNEERSSFGDDGSHVKGQRGQSIGKIGKQWIVTTFMEQDQNWRSWTKLNLLWARALSIQTDFKFQFFCVYDWKRARFEV